MLVFQSQALAVFSGSSSKLLERERGHTMTGDPYGSHCHGVG
jgi:hypothetical protein